MGISPADLLRVAIFASAALTTGAVLAVIRLHVVAVRRAPSGSGILPRHVLAVSSAQLFYVIAVGWAVLEQIGQPDVSGRLWFYLTANMLTLFSLYVVGSSQRRRVRRVSVRQESSPDPPQAGLPRHSRHEDPGDPP